MMHHHHSRKAVAKGSTGPPSVHLPKDLYAEFTSPSISFVKPKKSSQRFTQRLGGLSTCLSQKFTPVPFSPSSHTLPPCSPPLIPKAFELKERQKLKRRAEYVLDVQTKLLKWDPYANPNATSDAYNTLFVGALNGNIVTESMIADFMRAFGPVVSVYLIRKKHSAYAFVEFADKRALQQAYHGADKQTLGGRVILVDVERGRTVSNWLPRRFLGGLGGPPRIKGYTVRKGRGPPEPPKPVQRHFRRRRPPPSRGGGGGF